MAGLAYSGIAALVTSTKLSYTSVKLYTSSPVSTAIGDHPWQLYELAAMLMDKNTSSEQLRDLIETPYPEFVDADVVVYPGPTLFVAFNPGLIQARYSSVPWLSTKLGRITKNVQDHDCCTSNYSADCERTFSKLALIKNKLRTSCGQERLEKLLFYSVEQIDDGRVIDRFDGDNRRLALKLPCHFMGNQVCKFVIFLYLCIRSCDVCLLLRTCVSCPTPWVKILVTPLTTSVAFPICLYCGH